MKAIRALCARIHHTVSVLRAIQFLSAALCRRRVMPCCYPLAVANRPFPVSLSVPAGRPTPLRSRVYLAMANRVRGRSGQPPPRRANAEDVRESPIRAFHLLYRHARRRSIATDFNKRRLPDRALPKRRHHELGRTHALTLWSGSKIPHVLTLGRERTPALFAPARRRLLRNVTTDIPATMVGGSDSDRRDDRRTAPHLYLGVAPLHRPSRPPAHKLDERIRGHRPARHNRHVPNRKRHYTIHSTAAPTSSRRLLRRGAAESRFAPPPLNSGPDAASNRHRPARRRTLKISHATRCRQSTRRRDHSGRGLRSRT